MAKNDSSSTQDVFDRMVRGDQLARRQLVERVYDRLLRLTRVILGDFPALEGEHSAHDVLHEAWIDLETALIKVHPTTVDAFFRLAAKKIRERLLDFLEKKTVPMIRDAERIAVDHQSSVPSPRFDAATSTLDPVRLAIWTEFHRKVDELPDDEREVFDLHYYDGLTQAEVAEILGLPPKKISRLWISATERLADSVPESAVFLSI